MAGPTAATYRRRGWSRQSLGSTVEHNGLGATRGLLEEVLMLSLDEAFRKFKGRLELNDREQQNASNRQKDVREFLDGKFSIDRSFLTGSYRRHTKTKPLKDVDIFFVLGETERHYRSKPPSSVVDAFHSALVKGYGEAAVRKQGRSVNVDFGVFVDAQDNTDYRIPQRGRRPRLRRRRRLRDPRHRHWRLDQDQPGDPRQEGDRRASGLFQRVEGVGAHGEVLEQQSPATARSRSSPLS